APTTCTASAESVRATSAGVRPRKVRPSSVNATSATMGRSATARIASTASATSPRSDIVSTTNASTPPSRSPSACSRKASRASPSPSVPSGARYLPSGPIEPRTSTSRPMASRTSRASLTPRRLISRTCDPRPWTASLNRLAPNVLVSMQSAPAAMYSEWIACTSAGVFRFSTSKQPSSGTPRAYRRVPMAPSQRRGPAASRSLNACAMGLGEHPQDAADDLVHAEPVRLDHEVGRAVVRLALAVERLDLGAGALGEHRPQAGAARALVHLPEVSLEPDDRAERAQPRHSPLPARQPAAGRDHVAPLEAEALEDLGLKLAEARLAGLAEGVRNRAPLPGHDHVVGL